MLEISAITHLGRDLSRNSSLRPSQGPRGVVCNVSPIELIVVSAVVCLAAGLLGWRLLGKVGIGKKDQKPDCGCGSCNTKHRL